MRLSIIHGVLIFAAGAGCATVVAQTYGDTRPPTTVEEWQKTATELLPKVAALGYYVEVASKGTVGIGTDPIECGPKPPVPKTPENAVDPVTLQMGLDALHELENGYLVQNPTPVYAFKCHTAR